MAWEKRGNRMYLYRKKRIGKKVKSIYAGGGSDLALIERIESLRRQIDEDKRLMEKWERERIAAAAKAIDDELSDFSIINRALVDALFLVNGYHRHKRQWRKKRT